MIFFDLDGTLLDHKYSEYLGVRAFYEEYKECFECEEEPFYKLWCKVSDKHFNRYLKGNITFNKQRIERIKEIFSSSNITISDEMAEERFRFYLKRYEDNWKRFEDVIPCLQKFAGHRLGIISNGDLEQQSLKLEKLRIKDYFDCIITAGDIGVAKPDSRLFEIACSRVKEIPKECFYIGDDLQTDILPCLEVGMCGIWLNRKNEQLELHEINMINTLSDLSRFIL